MAGERKESQTLEPNDTTDKFDFDDWARSVGLKSKTTDLLRHEELDCLQALLLLDNDDVSSFEIPLGQKKLLQHSLAKLKMDNQTKPTSTENHGEPGQTATTVEIQSVDLPNTGTSSTTTRTPAQEIKDISETFATTEDGLAIFKIKASVKARDERMKTRKCSVGIQQRAMCWEMLPAKTLLMIGATGSGKTTLIDGMANYLYGVDWNDGFRLKLVDLEEDESATERNQVISQTQWITSYEVFPMSGCKVPYVLNIIDTPGFGDTRGIQRDKAIVDQLREFFSTRGEIGVDSIHAVCFVTQAPLARLTHTQKYIFESILAIFGKDIEKNIFALITFADSSKPPVLDALKQGNVPFSGHFVFNNSALFEGVSGNDFGEMFWKMGYKSFEKFFNALGMMQAQSLTMTKAVLAKREHLETVLEGLQRQINDGLHTLDTMKQEQKILEQHKREIKANENFEYEVTELTSVQKTLNPGTFVTNCLICNVTCHYPCNIPKDEDKAGCAAMDHSGKCEVCPGNCFWNEHVNNQVRYENEEETFTRTYDDLKEKYEEATFATNQKMNVVDTIANQYDLVQTEVTKLTEEGRICILEIRKIALRPDPLSTTDYIDLMIEGEKSSKSPGFKGRIAELYKVREKAQLREKVASGRNTLSKTVSSRAPNPVEAQGLLSKFRRMFKRS